MSAEEVRSKHAEITSEIKSLDRSNPEDLERFLLDQSHILPDSHQLIREVQYGLVCLFKVSNPEWLSNAQLLRKGVLCKLHASC